MSQREIETYRDVHAQLEANELRYSYTVEREVTIDELFRGGRLTLWRDSYGWSGYEQRDGEYWRVNKAFDQDEPVTCKRVTREAVVEAVERHIADPDAGSAGEFERGATPP
jgi:hypothetical protein